MQPYCANPYECTVDHPNSLENVAERGSIIEDFVTHEQASRTLKNRISYMIARHENPFVARFLHENAGKPIQTRMDVALMTRLAQYMHLTGSINVSETIRELVEVGLREYEKANHVNLSLKPIEFPDTLPEPEEFNPVKEPEPEPVVMPEPIEEPNQEAAPEPESLADESWVF